MLHSIPLRSSNSLCSEPVITLYEAWQARISLKIKENKNKALLNLLERTSAKATARPMYQS